ncbi:MAG TPA: ATPase domain-containing protein [Blastocatellia bacterium]|jgi:circadian clock protein KaiC|nr:ATPase domain-containing protein [Blastocatellia bacterium]
MVEIDNNAPDVAATGVVGLDKILRGGLPRNRIYLLEGNPGTGKTTLALQFLLEGMRCGEKGLYVTLSETKEELSAVARSHGWSLDGLTIYDLAIPEDGLSDESQYTLYHPSEVELGETTKAVFEEVRRVQPQRVVFDSLSEMRLLARDPLRYRRQILALKQFFIGRQSTVLLLDDHTSQESDRQLESLAHGVLLLEHTSPRYGGPRRQLNVLKLRGVNYVGGYHDFNIETGGMAVFPRLVALDHRAAFERQILSSGLPNLDLLTGGGLQTGTATLIMGPAGTGKSTLASQYSVAAAERDQKAAFFIFDEGTETLLQRCAGLGIDLRRHMKSGSCLIRQIDPAEISTGQFSDMICKSVEDRGVKVVIIDSLNGYFHAMPDENSLIAHMHEVLAYLNQQGILTILIVGQQGLFGSNMPPPVDMSYLADTVLLLRYFESSGHVHKAISVVKKRAGGHENSIRELRLTSNGIEVGKALTDFEGILTGLPRYTGKGERLMGTGDDEAEN